MPKRKKPKLTCTKCNAEVKREEVKPEQCDINTQSLLLMFGVREMVMIECPKCRTKRMLI